MKNRPLFLLPTFDGEYIAVVTILMSRYAWNYPYNPPKKLIGKIGIQGDDTFFWNQPHPAQAGGQ